MLKRHLADFGVPIVDALISPLLLMAALLMKMVRRLGIWRMPISKVVFNRVGVYPIRDHYYEPMYNYKKYLQHSLRDIRPLPGVHLNESTQLTWLSKFDYADELSRIPMEPSTDTHFYYNNPNFPEGDAECLYSLIRSNKPKRIIEIGSGFSTMMARKAINKNQMEDEAYRCQHICIEPYEMQWLDTVPGVEVIRQKVEEMDQGLFMKLEQNDILFVDSSHMIRPQSDVLCEYLQILPILKQGVLVHIHDIFTPRDYPDDWCFDEVKLWNEQYLLEAFLSCSQRYEIILPLNSLWHEHRKEMIKAFPTLGQKGDAVREPRSFWIRSLG